ncbi:hypothetical protein B5M09_010576 [Aphanomyces astaci]|uniref:Peptidase A2 domain-containing protein n=1 Tax=Aphanomyces astaci TaxID=112090 RepID=A0A3R7YJF6_APHAT|nr:hypothetical protein B5M09_010576 [Aphanomyces astaci]
METVVAVSLPPQNQAEMDELRMQSVERAAASSSQYNQMIYEQLAQFHAQQEAMAKRWEEKSNCQLVMAAAVEKNRLEQEVVQVTLLQQQEDLVRQQDELKRAMVNQAKATAEHQEMLRQASDAMQQQHYIVEVEELNKKQLPLAPKYKGNTKRERCEFMDVYLAYSRRVEVLNRGVGEIASLKMDTKIRDAESRVGRLLADFYEKLEQLDVAHQSEQGPKQSVKILMATIRPVQLKETVERQLTREVNKAYKTDVKAFCRRLVSLLDNFMMFESQLFVSDPKNNPNRQRLYGDKQLRQQRPRKRNLARNPGLQQGLHLSSRIRRTCLPGEAQRRLDQRFKKPQVVAVAVPDRRGEVKPKVVGAAVDMDEATVVPVLRTLECAINGLKATTLLDSGADQFALSLTFVSRLETTGNFTSAVRQLDTAILLGGFLEGMKLQVDRDVNL